MNRGLFAFLTGQLLICAGLAMVLPLTVTTGLESVAFAVPAAVLVAMGLAACAYGRNRKSFVTARLGASFLLAAWLLLPAAASLPYVISGVLPVGPALLESISACTTTGLSLLPPQASPAFIVWRSLCQWLGGLLFLTLVMTIMPVASGKFGLNLSGQPFQGFSQRLHHMRRTAAVTAGLYGLFTLAGLGLYSLCGLTFFDAVNMALITISTGGCYGFIQQGLPGNFPAQAVMAAGMFAGSNSFLLYGQVLRRNELRHLAGYVEAKAFCALVLLLGLLVSANLWLRQVYGLADSLRLGFFQVLSFASTTGASLGSVAAWPSFSRYILFILLFAGGSILSATGGIKLLRFCVLFKATAAEMRRTMHPHMVVSLHLAGRPIPTSVGGYILAFFFMYMACFLFFGLLLSLTGLPVMDSLGLSISCLTSAGPAIEITDLAGGFPGLPGWALGLCGFLMILGRLEVFAFFAVLHSLFHSRRQQW